MSVLDYRRFYAEEIRAVANLQSTAVVDALAVVPRERFLAQGPWTIRGEGDFQGPPRQTPDADPRHVHHNIAVAIDPSRTLFNGAPSVVAMCIDRLGVSRGARVLHIGTGLGYYTAIIGDVVGSAGRVVGIEVDEVLARAANANLAPQPWVHVRHGDGAEVPDGPFDAILVNAGVTHPLPSWFDALAPGGRIVLPLTATLGPATIGKGPLVLLTATADPDHLDARIIGFVAIYSALRLRDEAANAALGRVLSTKPFAPVTMARRELHEANDRCWFHHEGFCLA